MTKIETALTIGNITIDHNLLNQNEFVGPGGPPIFCAKILMNLGIEVTILSPRGKDFPIQSLNGTTLYPPEPTGDSTLLFHNNYTQHGRDQSINLGDAWQMPDLGKLKETIPFDPDIIMITPILDNISADYLRKVKELFPENLLTLSPQGFFRKIDDQGNVSIKDWEFADEILPIFDLVFLSEKDAMDADDKAISWSKKGPVVVVTRAEKGCTVYNQGEMLNVQAFTVNDIIDATGAGDVFSAAFCYAYSKTKDSGESAVFANATAGMSLKYRSNELEFRYSDIAEFAKEQGTLINIK